MLPKRGRLFIDLLICFSFLTCYLSHPAFAEQGGNIDARQDLGFGHDFEDLPALNFDHFDRSHDQCSGVAGEITITPNAIRILSFYDENKNSMAVRADKTTEGPQIYLENANCRVTMLFGRRDGPKADPSVTQDNAEIESEAKGITTTSASRPVQMTEIKFYHSSLDCGYVSTAFFINSNGITFIWTKYTHHDFAIQFNILSDNDFAIRKRFEKGLCTIDLTERLEIRSAAGAWTREKFHHF